MYTIAIIVVLGIFFLSSAIRILNEYERGVIFRLGRVLGAKGPGLIILIPIIDKMIKVADSVIERLSGMSARQIEDHSHRDYPWQVHQDNEEIDYNSVFFRSGEFANRDYEAMWLQASANDILAQLGEMSDDEYEYYLKLSNK